MIFYTTGAQSDRRLGVPGEDLPNSLSATEFVAWYNGHPDYKDLQVDLSCEAAIVVGVGNVAMDVARILASSYEELAKTNIADYALEALRASKVRDIYPVSYTHLDVYKRQNQGSKDRLQRPAEYEHNTTAAKEALALLRVFTRFRNKMPRITP